MANTLKFKRGLVSTIPTAALGEPLFTTDTFDLYIGNGTGNTRFQKYIASGTTSQLLRGDGSLLTMPIVLTSPANGQVLKYDGTNWVNSADAGVTGSGANGQVTFWNSASTITGSNNLFWDDVNGRLGVGRTPSARRFEIQQATGSVAASIGLYSGGGSLRSIIGIESVSTDDLQIASATGLRFYSGSTLGNIVTNPTNERFRVTSGGNFIINNASTDSGQRLQVTGDTLLKGSGNTSATTALTVQNSDGTNVLRVRNDGAILISSATQSPYIAGFTGTTQFGPSQRAMGFVWNGGAGTRPNPSFYFTASSTIDWLSSTGDFVYTNFTFNPTSGTGVLNTHTISPTINQTGGANGITRGLYVNPTLTAAANWRSIETSNNSGWSYYGGGTADSYFGGSIGVGNSSTASAALRLFISYSATKIWGLRSDSPIEGTLSSIISFSSATRTAASATITNVNHFDATQISIGAGSTITNQYGFSVNSSMTSATNNYGFYGDIASGTGRWNLFMNGSASNYVNGSLGVGVTTPFAYFDGGTALKSIMIAAAGRAGIQFQDTGGVNRYLNIGVNGTEAWIEAIYSTTPRINYSAAVAHIFYTASAERMRIFSDGNVGIATGSTNAGFRLDVNGTMRVSGASTFGGNTTLTGAGLMNHQIISTSTAGYSYTIYKNTGASGREFTVGIGGSTTGSDSNKFFIFDTTAGQPRIIIDSTGNVGMGTYTPSYKLDVQGTIGVSGAATFSSAVNAERFIPTGSTVPSNGMYLPTTNTVAFSTNTTERIRITSTGSLGVNTSTPSGKFEVRSADFDTMYLSRTIAGAASLIMRDVNDSGGVLQNISGGGLRFLTRTTGTNSSSVLDIASTGAATFSSSIQAATAIAIGTTPDTNKPFKILKNINGTVGINFENTSTGASAFSAIQMGTDVSGGTAFANLVYSSSGITATGVYQPSGTSLINTGSGGLNFLSVSQPIRFFTSSGNGTERVRIKNEGQVHFVPLAAAPTTSVQAGDVYYDSTLAKLRCYDGIQWQDLF